jgi:hypothetical protein
MEELEIDIHEGRWAEPTHPDGPASTYQVEFWTKLNDPGPPLAPLWSVEATRLTGVQNVREVLAWADKRAEGREVTVYVEVNRGPDAGRVRLVGVDPTWGNATFDR